MTEHEELLMLRALAAKQAQELEASKRIITERDEKIRKQNIQIDNMIQALLHARKKLFGPSTEVTQMDGQLSLFESVQELAEQLNVSKEKITVKPYTRVSRKPGVRQEMLEGLPQEVEEYVIPADETCGVCGAKMKVTGKRIVHTEVEFSPAKLIVKQIVQQVAKCTKCEEPFPESCHSGTATGTFDLHTVPDRTGNVSEVCNGNAAGQTGKRLVPAGTGTFQKQHGELGDKMQSGMAGTGLLEDS